VGGVADVFLVVLTLLIFALLGNLSLDRELP
jgi:hypothetical protein